MYRLRASFGRVGLAIALVFGLTLTAACDTAEERAEKHYQTGLALLESGDVDRALIEFRNVFKLNGKHLGARLNYARVQKERGLSQEAYSQYLRLVEMYPENLEGRRELAEMAATSRNWPEAERHVSKAIELAPDDILVQSIDNSVKYFHAVRDKDAEAQAAAVVKAQALVEKDDTLLSARNILVDDLLRKQDWYAALEAVDSGLAADPDNMELYRLRLGILQQTGDYAGMEQQLQDLMEIFPEQRGEYKQSLVRFYVAQQKMDEAEAFLREEAGRDDATTDDKVFLIGFLERLSSKEEALEEVEKQITTATDLEKPIFRSIKAKLNFDLGQPESAIAEMEDILKNAERNAQTRGFEVDLARMLIRQDNAVGARALIERVLSEDATQPNAVKLKANWLIDDDETGDAIVMLRNALNETPDDADLMSLLAKAYEREGNTDLKSEMMALAVQASGKAPTESMRYANFLTMEGKLVAAEGVLIDALRLAPQNVELLSMLGNVYAEMKDWGRTEGVIKALQDIATPRATAQAAGLTAKKLAGQERKEELAALLEGLTDDSRMGKSVQIALIRTKMADEGPAVAEQYLDKLLAEEPGDAALRFMKAGFLASAAMDTEAEEIFRDLLKEDDQRVGVWLALYRLVVRSGNVDGAQKVVEEGLVAIPNNPNLLWTKAGLLERSGDIEGAIAVYEEMYKSNSGSQIIANNLASLLATNRTDDESLQRAYTVSRRLRDSEVPAFQDTFGWVTFRRGDHETALEYLESAARGLPNDITVQYHLAVNYAALGRNSPALEQFKKVKEMVDTANPPKFEADVDSEIARLKKATAQE